MTHLIVFVHFLARLMPLLGVFASAAAQVAPIAQVAPVAPAARPTPATTGPAKNELTQQAALQTRLMQDIRAWVSGQSGVPPEQVEIGPIDSRLRVQACPAGLELDFPFPSRESVRVRCPQPAWQLFIRIKVLQPSNMVVASRPLRAGQILLDADLRMQPRDRPVAGSVDERSSLVGRLLRVDLAAGDPVLMKDIEDAQRVLRVQKPVRSGDPVPDESVVSEVLPRIRVPAGALGELPKGGGLAIRDLPVGHILLTGEVARLQRVLVAKRNLSAGDALDASQFELRTLSASESAQGQNFYGEVSGLQTSELSRNLRAGDALRTTDVRQALLVRRGQAVDLTVVTSSGLELSLRAEALADGRMGETVSLRNPESGRVLTGIVTGRNTARTR
jgi:flagella basal body P-ring formation protein FlgA